MAKALRFPSEESLWVAITSAIVPEAVQARPARAWRDTGGEGGLFVAPEGTLPKGGVAALASAGVALEEADPPATARAASLWAELVRPRRVGEPQAAKKRREGGLSSRVKDAGALDGPVVFVMPPGEGARGALDLMGELLRLGCDRQEVRTVDGRAYVRAIAPPYYTAVRAIERADGIEAYLPAAGGDGRVLVEIGWEHPLAWRVKPPDGHTLFIPGEGAWRPVPDGEWTLLDTLLDLDAPAPERPLAIGPPPGRLRVPLRLGRSGRVEPATLWILEGERAEEEVDRLVQGLPEAVLPRVLFAVARRADDGEPVVILRARPGGKAPPELGLRAARYAPHPQLANLFIPCDAIVEPPLRRERLRQALLPNGDEIAWLRPLDQHRFRLERVAESAFQPLDEWVDYVVDGGAEVLGGWARSALFDFEPFEAGEGEWRERDRDRDDDGDDDGDGDEREGRKRKRGGRSSSAKSAETAERAEPVKREKRPAAVTAPQGGGPLISVEESAPEPLQAALAEREKRFVELEAPADAPERQELWREIGELNARLGRRREAGLALGRVVWELPLDGDGDGDEARRAAALWAEAERRGLDAATRAADAAATLGRLMALTAPPRDDVRAAAAIVFAEAVSGRSLQPPTIQSLARWLDLHDDALDLRSLWLARVALSRLTGGDRLALARARDRILQRLHRGLSVEKDVPSFLRFVSAGREATHAGRLAARVRGLIPLFDGTKRTRSAVEAPPALTRAYVHFVVAYGLARLGEAEEARRIAAEAQKALDMKDPVHNVLARAFAARVSQAAEGLPPATPLPPDVAGALNGLDKFLRYKVDRLRQQSTVLEPQERLDPMASYQKGGSDPRGEELAALRGMTDVEELARRVGSLFARATQRGTPVEEKANLFDALMDFFPLIGEAQSIPRLYEILTATEDVPPARRAELLEEALMLAGHFGEAGLVRDILGKLEPILSGLGPEHAREAGAVLGGMLKTLRRVGLKEEAARLLEAMAARAQGAGTALLVQRVHLAGGLAQVGHADRARALLDEGLRAVAQPAPGTPELPMPERLQLTRALSQAVGLVGESYALAALEAIAGQLAKVTDSFNTNSHFCLSVVSFMESLVLGYASEDLALGELGRQWLDDDEYLVRRRVHRDLESAR
jgi:hypothetical protein